MLTFSQARAANFVPPSGCALKITVQNRGCTVGQHYVCTADAPGDQHVIYFDKEGPSYHSKIDAETRWLESSDLTTGLTDRLMAQAADPASFSTLLRTGRDDFDFWTESNNGEQLRHIGEDRLTGETVEIDGVKLELTQFQLKTFGADGQLLIESTGQQFINRDHGRFYGGVEHSEDWSGEIRNDDDSPVTFAFPGDAGFGATEPLFDCEMMMALMPLAERYRHGG
ncbi:hypothetical protein G7044_08200 [Paracoccus sp. 12-3]|nr:hypothetical protein [Paracoccus xiamenensis]